LLGEKLPEYLSTAEPLHLGRAQRLFPQKGVFENQQPEYLPHVGGAGYLPLIRYAYHKRRTGGLARLFLAVGVSVLSTQTKFGRSSLRFAVSSEVASFITSTRHHCKEWLLNAVSTLGAMTTALASPMGQDPFPTALIIPALAASGVPERRYWQDQANKGLSGYPGRPLQQIR
jgi:hypothetical protein